MPSVRCGADARACLRHVLPVFYRTGTPQMGGARYAFGRYSLSVSRNLLTNFGIFELICINLHGVLFHSTRIPANEERSDGTSKRARHGPAHHVAGGGPAGRVRRGGRGGEPPGVYRGLPAGTAGGGRPLFGHEPERQSGMGGVRRGQQCRIHAAGRQRDGQRRPDGRRQRRGWRPRLPEPGERAHRCRQWLGGPGRARGIRRTGECARRQHRDRGRR
ncbi:Uncharacterised protein [Bordetella pertussis]|nr:Uncharacterised protein [Bordetella pertussis]